MQYIKRINLDIDKNVNVTIDAKHNDTKSRFVEFTLYNNAVIMDLTNHTVKIFAVKADSKLIFNNVTIEDAVNGKVLVELTSQALAVAGALECELAIYGSDSSILTTKTFIVNVLEGIRNDSAIQSTNEFTVLSSALSQTQKWNDQFASIYPNLDQKYSSRLNALEGMQIGSRNYLKNSGYPTVLNYWHTNKNGDLLIFTSPALGHNVFILSCNPSESDIFMYSDYVQIERDASNYVFSFYALAITGGQDCEMYIMYTDDASQIGTINYKSFTHSYISISSTEIKKYELAVTVPAGTKAIYVRIDNNAPASSTQASQVYVWSLKLEKGSKSTDWNPAIEDVQAYTDNVQVGGTNWLSNSGFKNGFYKWGTNGANVFIDYTALTPKGNFPVLTNQSGLSANAYRGVQSYKCSCNPGDKFTLSATLKTDDLTQIDQGACIEIDFLDSNNNRIAYYSIPTILTANNVWQKFNYTAVAPVNTSAVYAYIYVKRNGKVWIGDIKLELGDKATEWSPAPEDIQMLCPTGAVQAFAMTTAPTGWLKCNGAAISRTAYANLFAAIGTTFGSGDGSTTFKIPDLRGQFIRGFDDGAGVDSGRSFGSGQNDMLKSHRHDFPSGYSGGSWNAGNYGQLANVGNDGSVHSYYVSTTYTGDSETAPKNISLLYCIKY